MDVFKIATDAAIPRMTEFTKSSDRSPTLLAFTRERLMALRPTHLVVGSLAASAIMFATRAVDAIFGLNATRFFTQLQQRGIDIGWNSIGWLTVQLIAFHIVLSLAGTLICRDVAVKQAARHDLGFSQSWQFLFSRAPQILVAPLIPLGACLTLAVCRWATGIALWVPVIGEPVHFVLNGFFLALSGTLLFLTAISWPLMLAAQCVENSDCFDGLSRSFNFVLTQPLRYGLMVMTLLAIMAPVVAAKFFADQSIGPVAGLLVSGLGVGMLFTWTATTFLHLRQAVDAIECDEIYVPKAETWAPVPLAGKVAHPVADQ